MQPPKQRRPKPGQGVSRARMLLRKHMGWLPGFPVTANEEAVRWRSFAWNGSPEHVITRVDGEDLRRMEFALTQLRHHFPSALPKLLPDVEGWLHRMDHLLSVLKAVIHHGGTLEADCWLEDEIVSVRWSQKFARLQANHPALTPLLIAVIFSQMTGLPQPSMRSLHWIEEQAVYLKRLARTSLPRGSEQSLDLQGMFFTLRDEMNLELQTTLFECLSDERFWQLPSRECFSFAKKLSAELASQIDHQTTDTAIPNRPEQTSLGELLQSLLRTLIAIKPNVRRQLAKLWNHLLPRDFLSCVRQLHREVEQEEARLLKRLKRFQTGRDLPANKKERKRLKEEAQVATAEPAQLMLESVHYAVEQTESLSRSPSHVEAWLDFFRSHQSGDGCIWLRLFQRWEATARSLQNRGLRTFRFIVSGLCQLARRHGQSEVLLKHWRDCAEAKTPRNGEFLQELLKEGFQQEACRRTLHLLEELVFVRKLSLGPGLLCSLVECVKATPDNARAAKLISTLAAEEDQPHYEDDLRAAFLISDDEDATVRLLKVFKSECDLVDPVTLLGKHLHDPQLRKVIQNMILEKKSSAILRLARFTQVVTALGLNVPRRPVYDAPAAWLAVHPIELHQELRELYSITPNAPRIADCLLSKDFPKACRLRQELEVLKQRLLVEDDESRRPHLAKRRENLAKYLQSPRHVSARRMANLKARLRRRAEWELLEVYNRGCQQLALDYLKRTYERSALPEAIFHSPYSRLLTGILDLKGGTRDLGLCLLFESLKEADWSFFPEHRNLAFQTQLESQGINMQPWVGRGPEVVAKSNAGTPYRLQFTRRILDFLLMGFHFETCLAPDSFNFFSAIANAVDLNKQVVYGKTDSGRIIGRCLFALTQEGTILTYQRYCYEESDGFRTAVDQFADELAKAMNTTIASSGTVPNLVAEDWYDDGAIQIESNWNLPSADSPVRKLLGREEPAVLIERLRNLVGRQVALETVLDPLLDLDEFRNRPEILAPFVERFAFSRQVSFKNRFRLAVLSHKSGDPAAAFAILDSLKPKEIVARLKRGECSDCNGFHQLGKYMEVFDLLNDYNPTLSLRILRSTRARDVKQDHEEHVSSRRAALAKTHRRLGRDQLAQKLAQQA